MSLLLAVWPYKNKIYRIVVNKEYPDGNQTKPIETIYICEKTLYPRDSRGETKYRPDSPEVR